MQTELHLELHDTHIGRFPLISTNFRLLLGRCSTLKLCQCSLEPHRFSQIAPNAQLKAVLHAAIAPVEARLGDGGSLSCSSSRLLRKLHLVDCAVTSTSLQLSLPGLSLEEVVVQVELVLDDGDLSDACST